MVSEKGGAMTEAELKKHLEAAEKSPKQIAAAVSGLPEETLRYKPPGKWCILEILGHLADMEIMYAYRMRQILADKKPVIAPIDQNEWAYHPERKRDVTLAEMVEMMAGQGPNHLEQIERLKKEAGKK